MVFANNYGRNGEVDDKNNVIKPGSDEEASGR